MMPEILQFDFMVRALLAGMLVGIAAPLVGVFLVQRRLALIGDGIGHVALSGVAIGLITNTSPIWTALIAAILAGLAIELIRARARASGDIALAVMFYGGIASGVVLLAKGPRSSANNLNSYLFGAITTTSTTDLLTFGILTAVVLTLTIAVNARLFAVANDPEYAQAVGLPVLALNMTLAALTAVTVVVSMRVVGLLLISALMILPNAIAQQFSGSFRTALQFAVVIGVAVNLAGISLSYYGGTPSGATIVVLTVGLFALTACVRATASVYRQRLTRE